MNTNLPADEQHVAQLQDLRVRIGAAVAELDRGEGMDGETFMQELIESLDTGAPKRKAG